MYYSTSSLYKLLSELINSQRIKKRKCKHKQKHKWNFRLNFWSIGKIGNIGARCSHSSWHCGTWARPPPFLLPPLPLPLPTLLLLSFLPQPYHCDHPHQLLLCPASHWYGSPLLSQLLILRQLSSPSIPPSSAFLLHLSGFPFNLEIVGAHSSHSCWHCGHWALPRPFTILSSLPAHLGVKICNLIDNDAKISKNHIYTSEV